MLRLLLILEKYEEREKGVHFCGTEKKMAFSFCTGVWIFSHVITTQVRLKTSSWKRDIACYQLKKNIIYL